MAYCIFRFEKAKSYSVLRQMYNHQYRISDVPNADKERKEMNDEMIRPEADFGQAFRKRLSELDYYWNHEFRKNGVMAYDIVVTYSASAAGKIDVEKWKEKNAEWLKETFGEKNVVSLVFHYDEAAYTEKGVVHGHAVVIPVDDKGKVNASYYTGSKGKMSALQDSYAAAMKPFGLQRGLRQMQAEHNKIRHFYKELDNAVYGVDMPERDLAEPPEAYVERVKEAWRVERAAHLRELKEKDQEVAQVKAEYRPDPEKDRVIVSLASSISRYEEREEELVHEFGSRETAVNLARTMKLFNEGITDYPDVKTASEVAEGARKIIAWAEDKERKRKPIVLEHDGNNG